MDDMDDMLTVTEVPNFPPLVVKREFWRRLAIEFRIDLINRYLVACGRTTNKE